MTVACEPVDNPAKISCEKILLAFLFQPPIKVSELKKHYPSIDVHGICLDLCQVRILTSEIKGRDEIFSLEPFSTVFIRFLKESTRFFTKKNVANNRKERKSLSFLFERGLILRGCLRGQDVLYLNSLYFLEVDPFFDIISKTLSLMNTSPVIDKKRSVRQFSEKDLELLDIDFRDIDHATITICPEGSDLIVLSGKNRDKTSSFFEITVERDGKYEIPPPVDKILGTEGLSLEIRSGQSGIFLVKGDKLTLETSSTPDLVEKVSEESIVAYFLQQKDSRLYLRPLRRIFSLELDKIITELCFKRIIAFRKGNNFPITTYYFLRTEIKMFARFMKRYFRFFESRNRNDKEYLNILIDRGLVLQGYYKQGYHHNVVYYLNAPRFLKRDVLFDTLFRAFEYSGESFPPANIIHSTGKLNIEQIRAIGILDTSHPKFIIRADNLQVLPSFPDDYKWGKHPYFEIAISYGKFEIPIPVAKFSGVENKSFEAIERPGKGFFLQKRKINPDKILIDANGKSSQPLTIEGLVKGRNFLSTPPNLGEKPIRIYGNEILGKNRLLSIKTDIILTTLDIKGGTQVFLWYDLKNKCIRLAFDEPDPAIKSYNSKFRPSDCRLLIPASILRKPIEEKLHVKVVAIQGQPLFIKNPDLHKYCEFEEDDTEEKTDVLDIATITSIYRITITTKVRDYLGITNPTIVNLYPSYEKNALILSTTPPLGINKTNIDKYKVKIRNISKNFFLTIKQGLRSELAVGPGEKIILTKGKGKTVIIRPFENPDKRMFKSQSVEGIPISKTISCGWGWKETNKYIKDAARFKLLVELLFREEVDHLQRLDAGRNAASLLEDVDPVNIKEICLRYNLFFYLITGNKKVICVISKSGLNVKEEILQYIKQVSSSDEDLYNKLEEQIFTGKRGKRKNTQLITMIWYDISELDTKGVLYSMIEKSSGDFGINAEHRFRDFGKDNKLYQLFKQLPEITTDSGWKTSLVKYGTKIRGENTYLVNIITGTNSKGETLKFDQIDVFRFFEVIKKFTLRYYQPLDFEHFIDAGWINSIESMDDVIQLIDRVRNSLTGEIEDSVLIAWENFFKKIIDDEKAVNTRLQNFGLKLIGHGNWKPAKLEVQSRILNGLQSNTRNELTDYLSKQLTPLGHEATVLRWNLTETVENDSNLQAVLLTSLTYGEKSPEHKSMGLGVEIGYNKFIKEIVMNAVEKIATGKRFSFNWGNEKKECEFLLHGLSLDGKNARMTLDDMDFRSTSGLTESKMILKVAKNTGIRHKNHFLMQLVVVIRELMLGRHGSLLGINLVEDEEDVDEKKKGFKIVAVILEIIDQADQERLVHDPRMLMKIRKEVRAYLTGNEKYNEFSAKFFTLEAVKLMKMLEKVFPEEDSEVKDLVELVNKLYTLIS
ncbi:MAG: hypothetical protein ACXAEU_11405 [Candidatus Hodarchaeales archaeon]|jgi:hypothetical protein